MANADQIEQELREYMQIEANLSQDDKLVYLKSIINKHFSIDNMSHIVNNRDMQDMISVAKRSFADTSLPIRLSGVDMEPGHVSHILILEAFISYLNRNKLLNRFIKFDIKK